ncbi:MAG: CinA family protein [Promethearchaeota archaeon]|nr:MAG: CinA family protein [Candidatus Lokiarchaeota archaeon]
MEIEEKIRAIIKKFTKNRIWIAIGESCTGGYISHMITNISGASKVFERGIVCYGNQAKIDLIKVNPKDIENYGAVSEEIARQMANNVRIISKLCDIGIGITGIAGPTGGTPEKPVGLVYIGYSTNKETIVKKYNFNADRITFKKLILEEIIEFLENYSFTHNF